MLIQRWRKLIRWAGQSLRHGDAGAHRFELGLSTWLRVTFVVGGGEEEGEDKNKGAVK